MRFPIKAIKEICMLLRHPLYGFWAAMLLFFSLLSPAAAQRDEGAYQILGARYGTVDRNVDVTDRLRQLAGTDRNFRVANDVFGVDPDRGETKALRIYARGRDGATRTFEYREGSTVDGSQFSGWSGGRWGQAGRDEYRDGRGNNGRYGENRRNRLDIVRAAYGTDRNMVDVTQRLRSMINDNQLAVRVTNELSGYDPAPRVTKTLWVTYSVGGRQQRVNVREGDDLRIP